MNNDIVLYANGKAYHTVNGVILTEEFSETLDSATIILDGVREKMGIAPYDFVRIKNVGEGFTLDKEMLVDNFTETESNITSHIYTYQINLMSETKLLEKRQCPNLSISHSLRFGKKSIAEHIDRYLKLYMPKVKMLDKATGKWKYDYIIKWDKSELEAKFGNECADMAMQMPTLRQLLTNLMLQNGCIPMVSERKLGWLDLSATPSAFDKTAKGINKTQRSNASDSYVNTLNSQNSQILDTGNTVISETLGFRDADNVFIKKQENLKLHTAFPIYKVTSCRLVMPVKTKAQYKMYSVNYNVSDTWLPTFTMDFLNKDGTRPTAQTTDIAKIILNYTMNGNAQAKDAKLVYLTRTTPEVAYTYYKTQEIEVNLPQNGKGTYQLSVDLPSDIASNVGLYYFYFISTVYDERTGKEAKQGTLLYKLANAFQIIGGLTEEFPTLPSADAVVPFSYFNADFTPCVVESSKRRLLDTDFSTMPSTDTSKTPSENAKIISKWIYGTVGYSIGSNEITGFSATYSRNVGWWSETYTYFENILNCLFASSVAIWYDVYSGAWESDTIAKWKEYFGGYEGGFALRQDGYYNDNFANALFDVMYQPLNDLTLKSYKEDTPLELEQLDNTAQGLTDFDRYALNEQQKADRLGNDVISINQTTDDESTLQPLNSLWEDDNAIVFRRTIAISKNYLQVTYNLSKDYVIKNYFTSITTKYRAYEHVDYSQSTLRKEHINVFVTIDTENHQGEDERIIYDGKPSVFLGGLLPQDEASKARYVLERGTDETNTSLVTVKYDVSVVASDRALAFVWQSQSNVGEGSYLKSLEADNGGLPQAYQIWGDSYYDNKEVGLTAKLPLYEDHSEAGLLNLAREPIVDNKYMDTAVLRVRDSAEHIQVAQYKDEGERMNTTLQFTYVNKSKDFLFTEELMRNMPYAMISEYGTANAVVVFERNKDFALKPYPNTDGRLLVDDDGFILSPSDLIELGDDTITLKTMKSVYLFDFTYKIVHAYKKADGIWEWVDIAGFKGKENEVLHVYLNDTNTQKIYSEDEYKVLRLTHKDNGNGDRGTKGL